VTHGVQQRRERHRRPGTPPNTERESETNDPAPTVELEGGVFTPVADRLHTWSYRPTEVSVAENVGGAGRQFGLIEAGSFAMLSLTVQLAMPSHALETARKKLAEHDKRTLAEINLVPAQLDVGPVTLLLGDGAATFNPLATTNSAGSPPFSAVFSLTLDSRQLANVKKAIQGWHGRLAARYEVTVRTPPRTTESTEEVSSEETRETITTTTSTGSPDVNQPNGRRTQLGMEKRTSSSTSRSGESEEPAAESSGPTTPAPEIVQTDAADWDLSSN
jgi:hypothetical protein